MLLTFCFIGSKQKLHQVLRLLAVNGINVIAESGTTEFYVVARVTKQDLSGGILCCVNV